MICVHRSIIFRNEPKSDPVTGNNSNTVSCQQLDVTPLAALTDMVFNCLEQAPSIYFISPTVDTPYAAASFSVPSVPGRRTVVGFEGDADEMAPLMMVAMHYRAVRSLIAQPYRSELAAQPFDAAVLKIEPQALYPLHDITGLMYDGQSWGRLAWDYPLKFALIRALLPDNGPTCMECQCETYSLDALLKEGLAEYEHKRARRFVAAALGVAL